MRQKAIELNELIASMNALESIEKMMTLYGNEMALASSLGAEDQVITHLMSLTGKEMHLFTLDTGRLFPESYDLLQISEARYHCKIKVLFPNTSETEKMVNEKGINLFYESIENRKLCCYNRKIEPLKRALSGLKVWITGLRREQAVTRTELNRIEFDEANNLLKFNPLIDWTEEQVWQYIKENHIPYNKLHDTGFPSIGCQPCTRAIAPGEDVRAGRWWWELPEQKECGLHKR